MPKKFSFFLIFFFLFFERTSCCSEVLQQKPFYFGVVGGIGVGIVLAHKFYVSSSSPRACVCRKVSDKSTQASVETTEVATNPRPANPLWLSERDAFEYDIVMLQAQLEAANLRAENFRGQYDELLEKKDFLSPKEYVGSSPVQHVASQEDLLVKDS